ncbi:TldD/PmbA family protein [Pseudomonas oryzihabitans]|uniref:TldD/PmbA family protein n=1 Tax=Pseudomonas oryzihabitans TaxID=47885 RepID=UPI00135EA436|nr:metallopeptidase TldD-related protein [Pseudomonas oryzihabitans]MXS18353.1 PmbA [Pseudomonas oryzihabitans]
MSEPSVTAEELGQLAQEILRLARQQGADKAQVNLSRSQGLSLRMRQGRVVSRTREAHSGFSLTVFCGARQGSVNSTDLKGRTLEEAVKAACAIARYTQDDPASGPAERALLGQSPLDLDLYHPWALSEDMAVAIAQRIENGIGELGPAVQSEDARVTTQESYFQLATSEGFNAGAAQTLHTLVAGAIARNDSYSERDHWLESARQSASLLEPEDVGRRAGAAARAYLDRAPLTTRRCPVLFDPRSATSLLAHFSQAVSGSALFMKSTFLLGKLGEPVMSRHLSLAEDPFIPRALASFNVDGDGIAPRQRLLVENGDLRGYLLSLYSARRLGLPPTGNGYGPGNLRLGSALTESSDHFTAMLKKLGTGFLVTTLVGNGVRLITGDYSRGARGFWVENGEIKHAVTGVTLSGDLQQMFMGIVAVGNDCVTQGAFTSGSILIDEMHVAGQ